MEAEKVIKEKEIVHEDEKKDYASKDWLVQLWVLALVVQF